MATQAILDRVLSELSQAFRVLAIRVNSPPQFVTFMRELGWDFPESVAAKFFPELEPPKFKNLLDHITDVEKTALELEKAQTDEERLIALGVLVTQVGLVLNDIRRIADQFVDIALPEPPPLDLVALRNDLPQQLLDYVFVEYLKTYHGAIYGLFRSIGAITEQFEPPAGKRLGYTSRKIDAGNFGDFLRDPKKRATELFEWGSNEFGPQLLDLLESVFVELAIPAGQYTPHPTIAAKLLDKPDPTFAEMGKELRITIAEFSDPDIGYLEVALSVYPIPNKNDLSPGVALIPSLTAGASQTIPLGGDFELQLSADLSAGMAVEIRPGGTTGRTGLFADQASSLEGELKAAVRTRSTPEPVTVFEGPGDSRMTFARLSHVLGVLVDSRGTADTYWELNLDGGALRIAAGEGDGFLQKILPAEPIESTFDLTMGWSSERGVYFRGSGGLEITIPLHITLGPIKLETVYIQIAIDEKGAPSITVSITAGAQIGPVAASVDRIGVKIPVSLPDGGGNAGPFQIEAPKFKPPTGAGLSIAAGGIVGGGFIEYEDESYAGILALCFGKIGLTAIGLITTRMPDGSKGFSMLINIGIIFDPPIQLSMGFTLSGVGGLIGINRCMDIEVLQKGIRNRTLDSILFPDPKTVIANAPKIISDLKAVFPPCDGRCVVGPMVKIGYGSGNFITADIGIFIELPEPIRIVLMGQVEAALPKKEDPIVILHLDVLGVLNIEKEEFTFQAALYDSCIWKYPVVGDSAGLVGGGNDRRFALSLGGFHPKFTPPPPPILFADLKRLSLSIDYGGSLQLACRAYQALTPNSLQFGASVELYASEGGATVTGFLNFDALIYFSPFSFEVTINGGVKIKYKGKSLADIDLSLILTGPTPWVARGKAKIKMLFTAKVGFCFTWGRTEQATLPPIDPWQPLQDALNAPDNWGSVLPDGRSLVESLRDFEEGTPELILVHPAGRFEVRQNVVPLGIGLDKVGNAPITVHDLFDISDLIVGGESLSPEPVEEFFARGQFEELADHQKLSVPSFEKMKGGVTTASEAVKIAGAVEDKSLEFESILIKPDRTSKPQKPSGKSEWEEAKFMAAANVTRRALRRAESRKRFSSLRLQPKVAVSEERYCIANAENLTRANLSPMLRQENRNLTRMAADQVLKAQLKLEPDKAENLIVIPEFEVEEAAV